ncbi:MAG: tryptophan--tRNA ligase [bacterium]|nr:tryptophan--tRNA ligase [bacterium]
MTDQKTRQPAVVRPTKEGAEGDQVRTLFSGIQPSGILHIGNYLGALKQWVALQGTHRVFAMIADLHAITVPQEPASLHGKTLEIAKLFISCGIDPEKSTIFVQSHVPAHSELSWILNTIAPIGELERMTQFKDKAEKVGLLAGLLNYPVLMAADILLYRAGVVPVGEDQVQHVELTRTLVRKFNGQFGETFVEPKVLLLEDTARVKGLDNPLKKMSKSAENPDNYIALLEAPDEIRRKIKVAVTDSGRDIVYNEEEKPAVANLMRIYRAFSGLTFPEIEERFRGKGYAEFKTDLGELLVEKLRPVRERFDELSGDEGKVREVLRDGAYAARSVAAQTLRRVQENIGLVMLS